MACGGGFAGRECGRDGGRVNNCNNKRHQLDQAGTEEKGLEANPAEISNSFRLRCLFFVRQTRNLNQNRVEGCRNVPL